MSNIFLQPNVITAPVEVGEPALRSIIAFKNDALESLPTIVSGASFVTNENNLSNGIMNETCEMLNSGSLIVFDFIFGSEKAINFTALSGLNVKSFVLGVEPEIKVFAILPNDSLVEVFAFSMNDIAEKGDSIVYGTFNEVICKGVRLHVESSSDITLAEIFAGSGFEFPRTVDEGFSPGAWSLLDTYSSFDTQMNAGGTPIRKKKGHKEDFTISYLDQSFMNTTYRDLLKSIKNGELVYFASDFINYPERIIHGDAKVGKSKYTTYNHSSVKITIDGNIQ